MNDISQNDIVNKYIVDLYSYMLYQLYSYLARQVFNNDISP